MHKISQALEGLESTEEELNGQLAEAENGLASVEQQEAELSSANPAEAEAFTSFADEFTSDRGRRLYRWKQWLSQLWDSLQAQRADV